MGLHISQYVSWDSLWNIAVLFYLYALYIIRYKSVNDNWGFVHDDRMIKIDGVTEILELHSLLFAWEDCISFNQHENLCF
jgi:hypothetical protein